MTELNAKFHPDDLEWRAGPTNREKTQAMALAYITARAVMDRLDDAVGPANWKDEYIPWQGTGMLCRLSIRVDGEWISKEDAAEATDIEPVKGAVSDAFKRAAVKWGIGRYLYDLPSPWVKCEERGRSVVLTETPRLPQWALPDGVNQGAPAAAPERQGATLPEFPEPAPGPRSTSSPAVPAWWPEFRALRLEYNVTDKLLAEVLEGKEPTPKNVQAWIEADGSGRRTFAKLISLAADLGAVKTR